MSKVLNPVTGLLEEQNSPGGATQIDPNYTGAQPTATIAAYSGPTNAQGQPWGGGVAKPGYDVFGNPLQNYRTPQYDTVGNMLKPDITVDENKIREDVRKQQQARIDAINSVYNDLQQQQNTKNEANLGVQRAISARSGLLGSTMGAAQADQVQQYNQQLTGSIESKRNLDIQAVYNDIDQQSRDQIAAQEAKAKGQMDDYLNYLKGIQSKAQDTISNMAASGIKLEDLAQEDLQKLLNNAQMSPIDAYALYQKVAQESQAQAPKPIVVNGVAYQQQEDGSYIAVTPEKQAGIAGVGGPEGGYKFVSATRYQPAGYFDPTTGDFKPVGGDKALSLASSGAKNTGKNILSSTKISQPKDADINKLLVDYPPDFKEYIKSIVPTVKFKLDSNNIAIMDQQFKQMKAGGDMPLGIKTVKPPAEIDQAKQLAKNYLASKTGADGFVSPQDYLLARNAWIGDGYTPSDFDTFAKGYKNPNNTSYVTDKVSKTDTTNRTL